jgi:hypothetical protein
MLRTGLIVFMFGGVMAWAQAQDSTPAPTDKVDRASAYYHYALAQYYSQLSLTSGDRSYLDKAKENYQEAVKADPQTPPLSTGFHPPLHLPLATPPKPLPPAPKSSPSPQQK